MNPNAGAAPIFDATRRSCVGNGSGRSDLACTRQGRSDPACTCCTRDGEQRSTWQLLCVSTLLDQSSSPRLPFARANSIFSLCYSAVLFSSRPLLPALLLFAPVLPVCRFSLPIHSHFLPDTLVADLHDHLGFAISFGVAMRCCICPTPCSIIQPISAISLGFSSHTLISIVATELVSTWALELSRCRRESSTPPRLPSWLFTTLQS